MIKVSNQRVINNLAFKSFKANKNRNFIAVIAIALTTILFTTLFTISLGIVHTIEEQTMRQAGGSAHASLKNLSQEEFDRLKNHPLIKGVGYNMLLGMAENKEFIKQQTEIWYSTEEAANMSFSLPEQGKMPKEENELVTDTKTLDLLGIPHRLKEKVTLEYTVKGEKRTHEFIVSGFYERDESLPVGRVMVSRSFIDKELSGINVNYKVDMDACGTIRADIAFRSSARIEQNIRTVIMESSYSVNEGDKNFIPYGVNWAYMSTSFELSPATIISLILAVLLIVFTGYLIIYNIFQISIFKDIRFYGLLKTIGTTTKQIKKIIGMQALILSIIGIPTGLGIGYFLGYVLLPFVVNISSYSGRASASSSPLIFLGSAVFSLLTVYISTRKPGRMAAKVSPVEAAHYIGSEISSKKTSKNSTTGGKLYKMALSNLNRSRKRTVIVVISMSLSLVLLNSVFTISKGFDMDKFVSKFVKTDFLIGHAKYFNVVSGGYTEKDNLSESFINAVSSQKGFKEGGRLYYNYNKSSINYKDGEQRLQLHGLEDFPLTQLDIVEGEFDLDKFKSGKYILEGLKPDDYGNIAPEESHYSIGDIISITTDKGTFEYEVIAKCKSEIVNHVRFWGGFSFYLPAEEFLSIVSKPSLMSYQFNAKDSELASMENFLINYTNKVEAEMDYESKALYEGKFKDLQNMILSVGGVLTFIMGFIGILNFINSVVTSIVSRRQEFAMLQSIGMTDKQLYKLLIYEGMYYALAASMASLIIGILFSITVIRGIVGNLWFFSYRFIVAPLVIACPIIVILSAVIPFLIYHGVNRQSIVERLREAD
jgi:putative ABC transport system permease protein